ncbi:unnamed protein product [Caenorhabditis brenneri]
MTPDAELEKLDKRPAKLTKTRRDSPNCDKPKRKSDEVQMQTCAADHAVKRGPRKARKRRRVAVSKIEEAKMNTEIRFS